MERPRIEALVVVGIGVLLLVGAITGIIVDVTSLAVKTVSRPRCEADPAIAAAEDEEVDQGNKWVKRWRVSWSVLKSTILAGSREGEFRARFFFHFGPQ